MNIIRTGFPRLFAGAAATSAVLLATTFPLLAQPEPPPFDVPVYEGVEDLPEIQLRMTEIYPPTATEAMPTLAMLDYIDRASNGKIDIEVFWSSALMSWGETGRGIASGLADMGLIIATYTPADFPIANYITQLSMLTDDGFPGSWLTLMGALQEFVAANPDIQQEMRDFGLEPLTGWGYGGYDNLCTEPWRTLEDAQGLRVRTPGQSFALQIEALGGVAVPTIGTEVFEAFSRGILDCVILQPNTYVFTGLLSVPNDLYWVNVPLTSLPGSYDVFNKEKWDSLPPVAQQIIQDAYTFINARRQDALLPQFRAFGDAIRSGRVEPVSVDPEVVDFIEGYNNQQLAEIVDKAPPQIDDPQAFVDQYVALVDKWQGIVDELGYPNDRMPDDLMTYVDSWYTDYDFTPFLDRLREELAKVE